MRVRELFVDDPARPVAPFDLAARDPAALTSAFTAFARVCATSSLGRELARLLRSIEARLTRARDAPSVGVWIAGPRGSGKSALAQVLGLAFGGELEGDVPLFDAVAPSPTTLDLEVAWRRLRSHLSPIAVVFSAERGARDGEPLHHAVLAEVRRSLGYASHRPIVAEHELLLEREGRWGAFTDAARSVLGRPWREACGDADADVLFSRVLHAMDPRRHPDELAWTHARRGDRARAAGSAKDAADAIHAMLRARARGRTLVLVLDDLDGRLRERGGDRELAAIAGHLAQRLHRRVLVIAAARAAPPEAAAPLFPAELRVKLDASHALARLEAVVLRKTPEGERTLRALLASRPEGAAVGCEDRGVGGARSEDDRIRAYPLVPEQIDLLLHLTTLLDDARALVRPPGLLPLVAALFASSDLGEAPASRLVPLDAIFEVLRPSLDADDVSAVALADRDPSRAPLARRLLRAIALLQLTEGPVTAHLAARSLRASLDGEDPLSTVRAALDDLVRDDLLAGSDRGGYTLQTTSSRAFRDQRDSAPISDEEASEIVAEKLRDMLRAAGDASHVAWRPLYSDGKRNHDTALEPRPEVPFVTLDLRHVPLYRRAPDEWHARTLGPAFDDRLVWVAGGDPAHVRQRAIALACSRRAAALLDLDPRRSRAVARLLAAEVARRAELDAEVSQLVEDAFVAGAFYRRGERKSASVPERTFAAALALAIAAFEL